jgi:hypothetical protein
MHALIFPSIAEEQCCGSGSVCFFLPVPEVRDTDPDPSINKQKCKENPRFLLFSDFFMPFHFLKNYVNVPYLKKEMVRKTFFNQFFVGVLKVNDENSRIRSRIRTNMSRIHNTAEELLLTFKKIYQNRPAASVSTFTCRTVLPLKSLFSTNY